MKTRQPLGLAIYLSFQDFTKPVSVVFLKSNCRSCKWIFAKDGQTSIDGPSTWVNYSTSFVFNVPHYFVHFRRTSPEHAVHTHTHKISQILISTKCSYQLRSSPSLNFSSSQLCLGQLKNALLHGWEPLGSFGGHCCYIASPSTSSEEG